MEEIMESAMPEVDEDLRRGVIRVLSHVWFSSLMAWVHGWGDGVDVIGELSEATRLLLR
jgi:hypothetical protein